MTPETLAHFHACLKDVRGALDALTLDIGSARTSAARLADAATKSARAVPPGDDCGLVAEMTDLLRSMLVIINQFAVMHDAVAAQAAHFARKVHAFELEVRKEQN
jgi:hypothetical protein